MFPSYNGLLSLFERGAETPLETLICAEVRIRANSLFNRIRERGDEAGTIEDYYEVCLESIRATYFKQGEENFHWHPIALLYARNTWGAELSHHIPLSEIKRLLEYELTRPYKPQSTN